MPKLSKAAQKEVDKARDEGGSFAPLDPGIYHVQLRDVTVKEGAKGPYWACEFNVVDPNGHGRLWTNISQSKAARFKVVEFFDAFEVSDDTDTDELLGKVCRAQVSITTIQKGDRTGEPTNQLNKLLPADEGFELADDVAAQATSDY